MQSITMGIQAISKIRIILGVFCVALIQACGGGGGDSANAPATNDPVPPPVSTSTTVTTTGVITSFGSVFVNGVEYETDSAEIRTDAEQASESDLKVGQIVTIRGSKNADGVTGNAESVSYNDNVEGPISTISGNEIVVLGQTIIIVSSTVFDNSISTQSLAGLMVGHVVEVSGFINGNGNIEASYIEQSSSAGDFELTGLVSNLDRNNSTFDIGNQVIDYAGALLQDFDGAVIASGDRVEVKGRDFGAEGELIATKVELKRNTFNSNDNVEIEGLISRFESASDFDVFGIRVTTTSSTVFERGTAADLALNVKVEVDGSIDSAGVLVARKVQFKRQENVRFEVTVDSADASTNSVVVLGVTVNVTMNTQLEDDSDLEVHFFGVKDISAGDFLELRGKLENDGTVTATRLERDDPDDDTFVRGSVQVNDGVSLQIAGVTALTTGSTVFRDAFNGRLSESEFFAAAQIGVPVKAKGSETGTSEITAREMELEND